MPSKNRKQLNFFLLVKAYKENGEIGVKRQWKFLEGYKPRLTPAYMEKLIKTAKSITDADLIDMTSGVEGDDPIGDTRELKPGYWALFRGKYKVPEQTDDTPKEGEFIAQIKNVNQQKGVVNFNHNGFRNKYGQTMIMPKRANASSLEFMYLDYALFDNVIKTGRSPQEVAEEKENLEESVRKMVRKAFLKESVKLRSKSDKGNRLFDMLKTAKFQHYDSPKGELSTFNHGEESRKKLVSKLSNADKKLYKEWLKTSEGQESLKRFDDFASPMFKKQNLSVKS